MEDTQDNEIDKNLPVARKYAGHSKYLEYPSELHVPFRLSRAAYGRNNKRTTGETRGPRTSRTGPRASKRYYLFNN